MIEKNYFTIREVSKKTSIPPHTIRYWEEKFRLIKPLRLSSGHRRYTRGDIETIGEIKDLLLIKGYSLAGARKVLNSKRTRSDDRHQDSRPAEISANLKILSELKKDVQELIREVEILE